MKEITKISDAEWRVCQVLWRDSPLTTNEIVSRLAENTEWSQSTIKTLLTRLVKKDVLGYRSLGREYHYFPKLSEEECVETHIRSCIDRVFHWAVGAMAAAFIKNHHLTNEEIAELKAILEQKDQKDIAAQPSGARSQAANPRAKT
ncbi:MAG: BlaI/MecI/CopY family transcriptional regulator [Acidobacteriota bacterium]|jgi:BlaI family penicillinase repressor|nr:BlaI/MecI/CopY family transcriptional regulator [Acidobacteriota bacterium]